MNLSKWEEEHEENLEMTPKMGLILRKFQMQNFKFIDETVGKLIQEFPLMLFPSVSKAGLVWSLNRQFAYINLL